MTDSIGVQQKNFSLKEYLFPGRKRSILVPFSIEHVRRRLQNAFANPIRKHPFLLSALIVFEGALENDRIEIKYTSYGRTTLRYNASGGLFSIPNGTHIELEIRPRISTFLLAIQVVPAYLGVGLACWYFGVPIMTAVPLVVVFGTVLGVALIGLSVAGNAMSSGIAAGGIDEMLRKAISGAE